MPVKNGPTDPVTNGLSNGREKFRFDPDDPEYIRDMQRPAVIKEDLNEMERRKRVGEILADSFRSQLEKVIVLNDKDKLAVDSEVGKATANQLKLSDIISPRGQLAAAHLHGISTQSITPVADLKGHDHLSKTDKLARNKLASLYRLVDLFQWSQSIHNHITMRLPDRDELLVNSLGLLYHEVTSSSLVTVDLDGNLIHAGSTAAGVSDATLPIHSCIHTARPDVRCVMHLQCPAVNAVASMKCGLLPMCQEAMAVGPISYHTIIGAFNEEEEQTAILNDLGSENKVIVVRPIGAFVCGSTISETFSLAQNLVVACDTQVLLIRGEGYIVAGETVAEALYNACNLVSACEQQVQAAQAGLENLIVPDQQVLQRAATSARRAQRSPARDGQQIQWKTGELEWEAWMRVLDNAGFRTGHVYRLPSMRPSTSHATALEHVQQQHRYDVQTPPSATGVGEYDEPEDAEHAQRLLVLRREQERVRWLNSPSAYQKVEFLETGTDYPKKITKWVQEETSAAQTTPIKITDAHHFSPLSVNPKEFREKQKAIKEARRVGDVSAGPRSHVLEAGMTQDEIAQMAEAPVTADRVVMIGTASKGIIDRDFRHNAQVYKQLYAPNPFAGETEDDIQRYMTAVGANTANEKLMSPSKNGTLESGRCSSPLGSPDGDNLSLMQAARDHSVYVPESSTTAEPVQLTTPLITAPTNNKPAQHDTQKRNTQPLIATASSTDGEFRRSKSERFGRRVYRFGTSHSNGGGADSRGHNSDDEHVSGTNKKEKKKKKRSFFSFGRKKSEV